jgi:hypothetical protein
VTSGDRADYRCCLSSLGTHPPVCRVMLERSEMSAEPRKTREIADEVICEGKSLREVMEFRLDQKVTLIMSWDGDPEVDDLLLQMKGEALGIAWCIALITEPFLPNVDTVRQAAMGRYYEAHPEELEED